MTKKKKILTALSGIFGVLILVGAGIYTSVIKLPITSQISPISAFPMDNANAIVANSNNVFVGRVIKQIGTDIRFGTPFTLYLVEVISNIKGNLNGVVTVTQMGGYYHGILYVMNGDTMSGSEADENTAKGHLLQSGATYVFSAIYGASNDRYSIYSAPYGRAFISSDKGLSIAQLRTAAVQNSRVQELMKAAGVTELK